jgi:hypothetical protein
VASVWLLDGCSPLQEQQQLGALPLMQAALDRLLLLLQLQLQLQL